jgi:hypothetical protein
MDAVEGEAQGAVEHGRARQVTFDLHEACDQSHEVSAQFGRQRRCARPQLAYLSVIEA